MTPDVQGHTNFRYIRLADEIEEKVRAGEYRVGEKLPSIRRLHRQLNLSISTVYQAFIELEKRGVVASRTRSGFFVKPLPATLLPLPKPGKLKAVPKRVSVNVLAGDIVEAMNDPEILQLGAAVASAEMLPGKPLIRGVKSLPAPELSNLLVHYGHAAGAMDLRYQIAKRTLGLMEKVTMEDIVTTHGCMAAVNLCLRAVAGPGDTVLVESPTFHGFLQLIEDLNMYAIEVRTDPDTGIDLDAFQQTVAQNRVKACILNPTFQNPLGALMPDDRKSELVAFAHQRNLPIIEDDIFGELFFGKTRPATLKSFDRKGLVLYCSSFSKTVTPGLRVGWVLPGKFKERLLQLKLNFSLTTPALNEQVAADFIKTGAFDRHLRSMRNRLRNQINNMAMAIARHFPRDTRITVPSGGMVLWVQLNSRINSFDVYKAALANKISIMPGTICSTTKKYSHYIRLNCALPWTPRLEAGIKTLGGIIRRMTKDGVQKKD